MIEHELFKLENRGDLIYHKSSYKSGLFLIIDVKAELGTLDIFRINSLRNLQHKLVDSDSSECLFLDLVDYKFLAFLGISELSLVIAHYYIDCLEHWIWALLWKFLKSINVQYMNVLTRMP